MVLMKNKPPNSRVPKTCTGCPNLTTDRNRPAEPACRVLERFVSPCFVREMLREQKARGEEIQIWKA